MCKQIFGYDAQVWSHPGKSGVAKAAPETARGRNVERLLHKSARSCKRLARLLAAKAAPGTDKDRHSTPLVWRLQTCTKTSASVPRRKLNAKLRTPKHVQTNIWVQVWSHRRNSGVAKATPETAHDRKVEQLLRKSARSCKV